MDIILLVILLSNQNKMREEDKLWDLFLQAKDSSVKVLTNQNVDKKGLESIFKAYWKSQNNELMNTLTQSLGNIKETILGWVNAAVQALSQYLLGCLKNGKSTFTEVIIDGLLNSSNDLQTLLSDPNELLPNELRMEDEDSVSAINDLLIWLISQELKNSDKKYFEALDADTLKKLADKLDKSSEYFSDSEVLQNLNFNISTCLFGKVAPELKQHIDDFVQNITKAKNQLDTTFDVKCYKDKFRKLVNNIENTQITRWTESEKLLLQCKSDFEAEFDKHVSELIMQVAKNKLNEELENCDSESDLEIYLASGNNTYEVLNSWIREIHNEDTRTGLKKMRDSMVTTARITCKSRPPKVKIVEDEDWKKYAYFKNEEFPVAEHKKEKYNWTPTPKKLPDGNILITFKDRISGKEIIPNDTKRLRLDNPYEVSREEWKEIQRQLKDWVNVFNEIQEIKKEIENTTDPEEKKELKKMLVEYTAKLPFLLRIWKTLSAMSNFKQDYIESKIPDFDPETIKITPDVMENLREICECAKTMLLWQKDILIIEWEAWVGKNVLIDIFAHFTHRPVFVFSCGKKTDSHDLTYQWILDENGSKKLNSKIYEAIHTPCAILVLDEINTMDPWTQKRLNALLDKRKELVTDEAWAKHTKALPDVLILGTMNPVSYEWTQKLAEDVKSRSHFIYQDYDWMYDKDGTVSYSDALRTYGNVNYFWKLLSGNGIRKHESELYEQALLDIRLWKKLTKKKADIVSRVTTISDSDFIRAWNILFNGWDKSQVENRFGSTFIEWMNDIYDIVLYSNYIRMRHKKTREQIEWLFPDEEEIDPLFEETSFSPRLVIQALEQLNNWNEIQNAKQAVIQTYVQQISDTTKRANVAEHLDRISKKDIVTLLKDSDIQKMLHSMKL